MSIRGRTLKNGRTAWDVRLRTPDGHQYKRTFRTRKEADTFEARELADGSRGAWVDPRAGNVPLRDYATNWLANRGQLRSRTRELYEGLLRLHIFPTLGDVELSDLVASRVRLWHSKLSAGTRPGASTTAKYRLLRTILNTAVEDGVLVKNPCLIEGAGVERAAERPIATVEQVYALRDAIDNRHAAMVLLATFAGSRLGELLGLRRRHVNLLHHCVYIEEQAVELKNGTRLTGPPKSDAGVRTVALPPQIVVNLEDHLDLFVATDSDALLFTGADGEPLSRRIWNARWNAARAAVGLPHLHFHDLVTPAIPSRRRPMHRRRNSWRAWVTRRRVPR
jgi:integrase